MKNELLRRHYERLLIEQINKNKGNAETPEDIWDNLHYLEKKVTKYDEIVSYLPLQLKKILAFILDPDNRIEYVVNKTAEYCEVEARFYWSSCETPAGIGFKKMYVNQIRSTDSISHEERESALEATVRGCAATRALTDAGIGLEFYGDCFDYDFEEDDAESRLNQMADDKLPQPENDNGKKAAKKSESKPVSEASASKTDAPIDTKPEKVAKTEITSSATNESTEAEDTTLPPLTLEDAKNAIIDIGSYQGNKLGDIFNLQPRNLIWLVNNHSAVAKEAKMLIETNPELKKYLKS